MALYRSKLGPVGGGGDGSSQDGGIVVDLDPLSAFALMGRGTAEETQGSHGAARTQGGGQHPPTASRAAGGAAASAPAPKKNHTASMVTGRQGNMNVGPAGGTRRVSTGDVAAPLQVRACHVAGVAWRACLADEWGCLREQGTGGWCPVFALSGLVIQKR